MEVNNFVRKSSAPYFIDEFMAKNIPCQNTLSPFSYRYSIRYHKYGILNYIFINLNVAVLLSIKKTDEQLMEDYRKGDLQAFDHLYSRYKDVLFRYLARQTGNIAISEEIFQDSWAALIKNRKNYTVKAKFKTYLFHIAHNKLIDYYRSQKNVQGDIASYEDEYKELVSDTTAEKNLENTTDTSIKYEYLLILLNKLPAAQRDVFLMHEETGMTLKEIANIMGVSRDTVKSRLKYAMQRLRKGMRRFT